MTRLNAQQISQYHDDGYLVLRGFFEAAEIAEMAAAFDAVQADALANGRSFRHGNLFYNVSEDANLGTVCRMAQWPVWRFPPLDKIRLDPRIAALLAPLIGDDLKQIINQLHWKYPGAASNDFAFHQDSRFRKPYDAYREMARSYIQTGIAIDPHGPESGGMRFVRGSHKGGAIDIPTASAVMDSAMSDQYLEQAGFNLDDIVDLEMEPGDFAIWHIHLVHGSGANHADHMRRFYINGYVIAENCDRGEWAFRSGEPVALPDVPSLVHYEQLHERPEPHFPDAV